MKTIKTTLALLLAATVILGTLNIASATTGNSTSGNSTGSPTPTPAPTPVTVVAQPTDLMLVANNVPAAVIEGLRQIIIANPAFSFPSGLDGHAVKSINVIVVGNKATARIVLSAATN
jgi:hypothetical protein